MRLGSHSIFLGLVLSSASPLGNPPSAYLPLRSTHLSTGDILAWVSLHMPWPRIPSLPCSTLKAGLCGLHNLDSITLWLLLGLESGRHSRGVEVTRGERLGCVYSLCCLSAPQPTADRGSVPAWPRSCRVPFLHSSSCCWALGTLLSPLAFSESRWQ